MTALFLLLTFVQLELCHMHSLCSDPFYSVFLQRLHDCTYMLFFLKPEIILLYSYIMIYLSFSWTPSSLIFFWIIIPRSFLFWIVLGMLIEMRLGASCIPDKYYTPDPQPESCHEHLHVFRGFLD